MLKYILCLAVALPVIAGELPQATPEDKLYRKTSPGVAVSWPSFGGMERVRLPDPMTVEQMTDALEKEGLRLELIDRRAVAASGRKRVLFWLPFIFISIAATFFLRSYGLQAVGVTGFVTSVSYVISGVIEVKMAENWAVSTWSIVGGAVVVVIVYGVGVVMWKDKGIGKPGMLADWLTKLRGLTKKER